MPMRESEASLKTGLSRGWEGGSGGETAGRRVQVQRTRGGPVLSAQHSGSPGWLGWGEEWSEARSRSFEVSSDPAPTERSSAFF